MQNKVKTILLIAPSLNNGGIERSLVNLSKHFVARGHRVVYVACRRGEHFFQLEKAVKFVEPDFTHKSNGFGKIETYVNTIRYLRLHIKREKPDAILSFGDIINPLALIANMGLPYPIYISDRISPKQKLGFFKNLMKQLTYRRASGIIAQSQMAADYKRKVFGDKINLAIIPNSLRDIEEFPNMEKENWVIGVGRLSYEKGFDRLIDAFSRIRGHEDWKLVLVGDGPEKAQLERLVETRGIKSRVVFLGKRNDVDRLFAQSKIFVIPSRCEGFPNALCEAMASPLPCISFDSIAASDLIENRVNGVVLSDGDIGALAKEICVLMDDERLRDKYAKNACQIRGRLDKNKVGNMFLKYILDGHL